MIRFWLFYGVAHPTKRHEVQRIPSEQMRVFNAVLKEIYAPLIERQLNRGL